jgi:hypothetical protein
MVKHLSARGSFRGGDGGGTAPKAFNMAFSTVEKTHRFGEAHERGSFDLKF